MRELTLRYPGHIDLIKALRHVGFFSEDEIDIKGVKLNREIFRQNFFFKDWKLGNSEPEFTVMRLKSKEKLMEKRSNSLKHFSIDMMRHPAFLQCQGQQDIPALQVPD
ncbi:MAG: hypothetical protein IPN18_11395 [Ignavibacteriales bacterium]|nr:hypothetical protein [Ignavibacteriales bacterium]